MPSNSIKLMKSNLTKSGIDEIHSSPPKKNYPTKKTIVTFFDDIWSTDSLNLLNIVPQQKGA